MKKEEAIEKLKRQIGGIGSLKTGTGYSPEHKKWLRDTEVAIQHIFGSKGRHLGDLRGISYSYPRVGATDDEHQEAYLEGLNEASVVLESFIQEINDYWPDKAVEKEKLSESKLGADVFIVHGHDEAAKEAVARFVEKLELKPIILHEQPDKGRTVIEKFEDHSNVGFAIVLLTPDDVGASVSDKDNLTLRARQNVVFELGFFLGKLGRNRVCALYKGDLEIPSDYEGVLFVPMEGDWRLSLAKEIKAAGISIDLNKSI